MTPWPIPARSSRTRTPASPKASTAKFDAVCRKLQLVPDDHVLEIGTGWGGFAIHAAQRYGCRVTTTTISRAQYEYAQRRIYALGLDDRITCCCRTIVTQRPVRQAGVDRNGRGGRRQLPRRLFRGTARAAEAGRRHAAAGHHHPGPVLRRALESVDFIQRYVFPGQLHSLVEALAGAVARATDFKIFHLEDIGPHYARTLRLWREHSVRNLGKIRALGYGEELHAPVGVLPVLLRRRLHRASAGYRADVADQAALPARAAVGFRGVKPARAGTRHCQR